MGMQLFVSITFLLGHQASLPNISFSSSVAKGFVSTERDIQQTLLARKILSESPELASLNLIVRYRSGIVTVSGPVHDKTVMDKVVSVLEGMRGVEKIQKELYLGPLGVRPSAWVLNDSNSNHLQLEVRRNPLPVTLPPDSQAVGSLTSGHGLADRKEEANSDVLLRRSALAILELIRAEPKFAGIHYSLNDGIVVIDGNSNPQDTMEFAHRLAKIPGLLGVRISQD